MSLECVSKEAKTGIQHRSCDSIGMCSDTMLLLGEKRGASATESLGTDICGPHAMPGAHRDKAL